LNNRKHAECGGATERRLALEVVGGATAREGPTHSGNIARIDGIQESVANELVEVKIKEVRLGAHGGGVEVESAS
jgi:hypothetical protein